MYLISYAPKLPLPQGCRMDVTTTTTESDDTCSGGEFYNFHGIDYFPGTVLPNPNRAGYPPAKLGKIQGGGTFCGAVCTLPDTYEVVDCACTLTMECVDGTTVALTGSTLEADGSVVCVYKECNCPVAPFESHTLFGTYTAGTELCELVTNNHPTCEYNCCPYTKECGEFDMTLKVGMCDLIVDDSPESWDYDCGTCGTFSVTALG